MDSLRTLKKAFVYLRPFRFAFFVVIFLTFLKESIWTFSPFFLGKLADSLVANSGDIAIWFAVLYFLSRVIPLIFDRFLIIFELKRIVYDLENYFNVRSIKESLNLSLGQIKDEHSGFKQDLFEKGKSAIRFIFDSLTKEVLPLITSIFISLIGLFIIDRKYFFVSLIFLILYTVLNNLFNLQIKENLSKSIDLRKERNKVLIDILRNLFFIKFSGQSDYITKQLNVYQNRFKNFSEKIWLNYHNKLIVNDILMAIFVGLVVFFSFKDFQSGIITIGMFFPIMTWSIQLSSSLSRLKNIQREFTIRFSDLRKMFGMLEQKSDIYIPEKPLSIKNFEKEIVFGNVSFNYKEGKQGALTDVDLVIKKGEKVALVGKSGSGKSTIVSLILRLYDPNFGSIKVDGVDLKEISVGDWHDLISFVQQDGDLIDMTIKENVLIGAKKRETNNMIENALKQAEAYDFVMKLPNGLNTKVGERGVRLSGGQKQRVCIARALIKNSPILILDEATSSLDSETEQFLNKNIWEILSDKTGIVIAHRLSTILDADKIVVVDNGEVVGIGKHAELIKSCGFYKRLVDTQNIGF